MARRRRNDVLIPTLGVLFDCIAIECAFLLAYWLRFHTSIFSRLSLTEGTPQLEAYIYGSLVIIPVWLLIFRTRDMYGARRNVSIAGEFFSFVRLVTIGMLVVMSAAFFYRAFSYSRIVFGLLWIVSIVLLTFGRGVLVFIEKALYRSGRELRNAVIIGSNDAAERICSALHNHPLLGYRLIGYFAEQPVQPTSPLAGIPYLGTYDGAASKIASEEVELALFAMMHEDHPKMFSLVQACEGISVEFLLVPDIIELMASTFAVKKIEGIPFLKIKGMPMTTWGRISKRSFDLVLASLMLFMLLPLFLVAAIFIKLTSKGPVFYRQERLGMDGRMFDMLKFRSMMVDAESETGPVWTKNNDARRTAFGTLLRKTSIDEIPQLINVVKGEMSLVGPRPERPHFVEQFKDNVPKYLDRHRVKTGITGWAQVNGLRGNTSLEERIKFDIYYIENWSMGFDLKILFKTIRALVSTKHVH